MSEKQTHGFQAEVNQLLKLMIHSLYSNKEIFLRELVSNASDACDKLRFLATSDDSLYEGDGELEIKIDYDPDAKTITLADNGIGMTSEEVVEHIGTIAKSGTRSFFDSLTGDQAKDSALIGQFGVGFYSSFIVAEKVTLTTRKAGESQAVQWESTGEGDYTLEKVEKAARGTEIVLHLREDEAEFLDRWRLRGLITKYSDHVAFPVKMFEYVSEEDAKEGKVAEYEQINKGQPLWTRAKADISDEEYKEFYKASSHDFEDPLLWSHNRVEGKQEYTSLLYIPSKAPYDMWERDNVHGIKLYVQRVFIMDEAEKLMPRYMRFVRGVIDSADLPLNVSREILQGSKVIDNIRAASVKKVLSTLEKMAKNNPEQYAGFWKEFGAALKEGPGEDAANKDKIAKLLRFSSSEANTPDEMVSFDDYISRMKEGQDKIYFITADSFAAAKNSPHLEVFRKKGIEVLLLSDRVDEWLMSHLTEFDGKQMQSVAKGDLDLGETETDEEKAEKEKVEEGAKGTIERMQKALEGRVQSVKVTHRLTDSPACIVADQFGMSANLERMLKSAGQEVPESKPTLEINPSHPVVTRLESEKDDQRFNDWSEILLDQAILSEGGKLDDPASFVRKLNQMLLALEAAK
ncbi:MAG: molecular chaperone HtpG [Gammaproteobacteria bacterium]|jgi:molecular chaperone HtpG